MNWQRVWDKFKRQALYTIIATLFTFAASMISEGDVPLPAVYAPIALLALETLHRVVREWLGLTPVDVGPHDFPRD